MPNFAKLSQVQWSIIRDVIRTGKVQYPWSEAERVAQARAITRLAARGIVERIPDNPFRRVLKLAAPLGEIEQAARNALARDMEKGEGKNWSRAWWVLRAIREKEEVARHLARERRREQRRLEQEHQREQRRREHREEYARRMRGQVVDTAPHTPHATLQDLDPAELGIVKAAVEEVQRRGYPVTTMRVLALFVFTPSVIGRDPEVSEAVRNSTDEELARLLERQPS
jgi:hypothetical protein